MTILRHTFIECTVIFKFSFLYFLAKFNICSIYYQYVVKCVFMSNIVSAKINMLIYLNHIQIIYSLHFNLRQIFYLTPSVNIGHDHNICVLIFCWFFLSKYTGCPKKNGFRIFAFKWAFSVPFGHFRGLPNILGGSSIKITKVTLQVFHIFLSNFDLQKCSFIQ